METKIKTLVIEDNEKELSMLLHVLGQYFPDLEVVGTARTVAEGVREFDKQSPELVLLDIELPDGQGFDIIEHLRCNFIITTSFDKKEYLKKAIKLNSVGYIEKPVNHEELREAVEKFKLVRKVVPAPELLQVADSSITYLIPYQGIVWCKTNKRKTAIKIWDEHTREYELIESVETIGYFTDKLCHLKDYQFYMPHRSYIINLHQIKKYNKGVICMKDGEEVTLSRDRKAEFEDRLKQISRK